MFLTVGANTINIQDLKLDDGGAGMVGWGDVMQIVGPLGNAETEYLYWDASIDPKGEATTAYWGDAEGNAVSVTFDKGDGVGLDNANGLEYSIQNAGQVPSEKVTFAAREGLNWSGNPFPAPINLSAVVLNDKGAGMVGWGDVMQIVGPLGNAETEYLYWDASIDPKGEATTAYWGDAEGNAVNVTLQPGAGFAVDNANGLAFDIEIACPY